mgnify:CR=1 FL=1
MKKILFSILFLVAAPSLAAAGQVTITNQYPSPAGIYDWLQLVGRGTDPFACGSIAQGRFYVLTSPAPPRMMFCNGVSWIPLSGPWTEDDAGNNIFLSGANPENKKVGIGTATPFFRLTMDNTTGVLNPDGGIFARGIFDGPNHLNPALSDLGLLPAASRPLLAPESYFIWYSKNITSRGCLRRSRGLTARTISSLTG